MAPSPSIMIWINNRQRKTELRPSAVRRAVREVLRGSGVEGSFEVGVSFVESGEMSELNRKHLGREGPTDVISFPMDEEPHSALGRLLLGDVVVCPEVAAENARSLGEDPAVEICRVLVHGLLHLRGWEDGTARERSRMRKEEDRLLLGLRRTGLCVGQGS